jgi:phosphoserine phosphatase RsbU/P
VQLQPSGLLVICTDGVTEAPNLRDEEYGEKRLAETIQKNRNLPATDLLAAIQGSVEGFSRTKQADDITLIARVARAVSLPFRNG